MAEIQDPVSAQEPLSIEPPASLGAVPVKGGAIAYLQVDGAMKAADFYRDAFGAELAAAHPVDEQGRTMHVHLYINGSSVMLSDAFPEYGHAHQEPQGFTMTLQVEDIDAAWARAVAAGAAVVMPVTEMFWGARYGQLRDPFGILWAMNQPIPAAGAAPAADAGGRELVLTRHIAVPRATLYRCWTEPELLKQWFAPLPYTTPVAELDVRPGGTSTIVMRGPDGVDLPNPGVYLEVVENERLVMTDAFTEAWQPSEKPFMTLILTFEDEDGGTRYTARVRHGSAADRKAHEDMGFDQGWGQATDQLAALAARL